MAAVKKTKGLVGLILAGATLGGLGGGAGCGQADGPAKPQRPPPLVLVRKPLVQDVAVTVRAPVELRPLVQADLVSKQLGYLSDVFVERGDAVKRGQPLALVRPSELPDQLEAARGALAQAQAQLALARENRARVGSLAPAGVVSTQELSQSGTTLAQSEAAEAAARANLQALAVRLGETRMTAPLDGVVLQRRVDPGALVGPQTGPVLTVGRIDVLRVFVAVRERDAPALRVGQDTTVEVDARPGERFRGKVVRLSPAFDPLTRTLDAEVHLPNPDGKLRPGMYGRAAVQTSVHQGSLVVPEAAVQLVGEQRFVFIAVPGSQGHKAARRAVTIGVDGGEWLELTRGVRPEDEVIVAGIDALADGAPVRTQQSGAAPGKPAKAQ